jgi:hypothetical protein
MKEGLFAEIKEKGVLIVLFSELRNDISLPYLPKPRITNGNRSSSLFHSSSKFIIFLCILGLLFLRFAVALPIFQGNIFINLPIFQGKFFNTLPIFLGNFSIHCQFFKGKSRP